VNEDFERLASVGWAANRCCLQRGVFPLVVFLDGHWHMMIYGPNANLRAASLDLVSKHAHEIGAYLRASCAPLPDFTDEKKTNG
jgi:hypothetical protein